MPREARQGRNTGLHHIVVQGRRLERIFGLDEDKDLYLETVLRYKDKTGIRLYAYCLLDNHAHLVIQETEKEDVTRFMRRVGVSYAYWYRQKHYDRESGKSVFRGRYMSEPLETEEELLETIRYIHQEPVKKKLVEHMEDYVWSSYRLYLSRGSFIDRRRVLDSLHFSGGYRSYMEKESGNDFLEEIPEGYGRKDEEIREILKQRLAESGWESLEEMDEDELKNFLRRMHYVEEISIAQLARITEIPRGFIQRL